MSSPDTYSSLNTYIQKVTDEANNQLEPENTPRMDPIIIGSLITAAAMVTTAAIAGGALGGAYLFGTNNDDGGAQRRSMRLQIQSNHWGVLRLAVGQLETTFVIPPDLNLDGQFNVVLYNKDENSPSRIFAEYTGFPFNYDQDGDSTKKAESITTMYEFATKADAYVQINHTKPLPAILMSANLENIDDWGNG